MKLLFVQKKTIKFTPLSIFLPACTSLAKSFMCDVVFEHEYEMISLVALFVYPHFPHRTVYAQSKEDA